MRTALLSTSDRTGLLPFARRLHQEFGYHLLSTGGTARALREGGLEVEEVSERTGFPEILDGRVKTLHPRIHAGILARRDHPAHRAVLAEQEIPTIDLVAVNLYPFAEAVATPGADREMAIENIDIGGPTLLRSAAKNADAVTVICEPTDYEEVLATLARGGEEELRQLRRRLAAKVFRHTQGYDRAVADYLEENLAGSTLEPDLLSLSGFPRTLTVEEPRALSLRYGENPHQQAALYGAGFFDLFEQLQGKELSYNNILDLSAAAFLIGEFEVPSVAILKHTNPCGVASADRVEDAWEAALATDRQSAFGGIIAVSQTVSGELARRMGGLFAELILAPDFDEEARAVLAERKNLRLLVARSALRADALRDLRSVAGGLLVQDRDQRTPPSESFQVVTRRGPTEEEWTGLRFAWKVVKHVKSNAIVYGCGERTLGIGAGQMSRVDSSRIAVWKAAEAGLSLEGSVVASDAFFPFADGLQAAAAAGATAAIQPGGSRRDEEVIAAADEAGMAMIFTGARHFRH